MTERRRPVIGLSSCLAGENVRYDGSNKRNGELLAMLGSFSEWMPVCPEVGIGLGIPRPPIRLTVVEGRLHVRGVDDPSVDVTAELHSWAEAQLPLLRGFDGYVFKARSPSCGVTGVPRLHSDGHEDLLGRGYFAGFVHEHLPQLPLADEDMLADPQRRRLFVQQVKHHFRRRAGGENDE